MVVLVLLDSGAPSLRCCSTCRMGKPALSLLQHMAMQMLEAAAVMRDRNLWTVQLAKQMQGMPEQVRTFLQNPQSDLALLESLVACYLQHGSPSVNAGSEDPLSGGQRFFEHTADQGLAEDPFFFVLWSFQRIGV